MGLSIVLADDHAVVRDGLRRLLEAQEDFEVIGETGDGLEVLPLVERLRPRVLILDVMMPGVSGPENAREISKRVPSTAILMLSMYADESYVLESLRNGAAGYVVKSSRPEELIEGVRAVAAGRRYLSSEVAELATNAYANRAKAIPRDSLDSLTSRERQVLHLVAEGLTYLEIGERLGISARTVETHRANLSRKLGLTSQVELVRYAFRRGLVAP